MSNTIELISTYKKQGKEYNLYKLGANQYQPLIKGSKKDIEFNKIYNENIIQWTREYEEYKIYKPARKLFRKGDVSQLQNVLFNGKMYNKDINIIKKFLSENKKVILKIETKYLIAEDLEGFDEKGEAIKTWGKGTEYRTMTATNFNIYFKNYFKKFKIANIDSDGDAGTGGSDKSMGYWDYSQIENIEMYALEYDLNPNNKIKKYTNKASKLFNYINTTDIDLTKYQIIKETDDINIAVGEHCLMHCLKLHGISDAVINSVKSAFDEKIHFPKSKLYEVSELINKKINLFYPRNNESKKTRLFNNTIYGDESLEEIKICAFKDHYFIYEDVDYTLFSIKNYNEIKNYENFNNFTVKKRDKYISKKPVNKINSLQLIYYLFENNHFISHQMFKPHSEKDKDIIYLDNIENEQEEYEQNNKSYKKKIVFFADTETSTVGENHKIFLGGIINETDEKPKIIYCEAEYIVLNMLNYVHDKIKNKNKNNIETIIYFHNLKYDYNVIKEYINILSICEKDNQIYQVKIMFKGFIILLNDSYKLISIPLSKFQETFNLPDNLKKQEAIAYTYYNENNKNITSININEYIKLLNPTDIDIFYDNLNKNVKEFEYNIINKTFNPIKYYKYYLHYDVMVLREGLKVLKNSLYELSELNMYNHLTISTIVDKSFKNYNSFCEVFNIKFNLRDFISKSIIGGRVCVNEKYLKKVIQKKIVDYDAVSLYPSAIFRLCEEIGLPKGKCKKIINLNYDDIKNYSHYVVKIKLLKINKKQQIPFIGVKNDIKIDYINEVNEPIELTVDKIALEDYINFHHIEFEIIEGVYWNEGFNKLMGSKILELFNNRKTCKKLAKEGIEISKNEVYEKLIKLMLNSVYGKTIMKKSYNKKIIVKNEVSEQYLYNNYHTIKSMKKLNTRQNIFDSYDMDTSSNYAHIGGLILSYSKRIMNEVMNIANDNNINIYYQDTDSMHMDYDDVEKLESLYLQKYNKILNGDNLGQFHSDFEISGQDKKFLTFSNASIFLGKKSYIDMLESRDKENNIIYGSHIRLKGITKEGIKHADKKDNILEIFKKLANGGEYTFILNPNEYKPTFRYDNNGCYTVMKELPRKVDFLNETERKEKNKIEIERKKENRQYIKKLMKL